MNNIFHWVEIRTRDLNKSKKFYESLFGWKVSGTKNEDFAYWTMDTGSKIGSGMWRMPKEKPLGVLVYILVDDIAQTLKRVEELGGKITMPKTPSVEGCFMAFFTDPEGNPFGLWEEHREEKKS
jgi:predicted enzyme related to lactoylglutathione lyase